VYQVATAPLVLVVHPSVPAGDAADLLKYLRAHKGKVSYGSYGQGAYPHLAGAHMSLALQADMNHVPYKGEAPMVQDLLAGQIQMAYASALQVKQHVEAGKLKAIGVTGDRRMPALPNVPTLFEQGLTDEAYRLTGWLAVAAPAGTPAPVVRRIAADIRAAVAQPEVRARIEAMGFEVKDSSPEAFAAQYAKELPVWERLIRQSGAKLE
jgi:tripartite-type tricarboxylate transporter receptor subunit TctC